MLLYANGDSHTASEYSYAGLVAKEFGYNICNEAIGGSSNASIIRRTREYITNNKPDFLIIGWSTWDREEWFYDNNYYDVNSSGHATVPGALQEKYKNWVRMQTSDTLSDKSKQWHNDIHRLHKDLNQKNIRHLFFNCMYNFVHTIDGTTSDKPFNWNNQYIDPYDNNNSYYWYLKSKGIITDEWYHYGIDGHTIWAEHLINHIKENRLI